MKNLVLLAALLFSSLIWSQSNISKIEISNLNQEKMNMAEVLDRDKFTLLSVGGTWCKPCLLQKPFVASLEKQYPQYLKVVFLFSRDTPEKVKSLFASVDGASNYFLVNEKAINQLDIKVFPTHILVNSEGRIVSHDVSINDVGSLIK